MKPSELKIEYEQTLEGFNLLLNSEPNHVEVNPDGYKHIPIAFIEHELRFCFRGLVQYEIIKTRQLFNSVNMDVRIRVYHPILEEWLNYDGSAAVLVETISEGRYKNTNTVVKAEDESIAIAQVYSEAIKKAAQRIGVRFGANLNRENTPKKLTLAANQPKPKKKEALIEERILHLIQDCTTIQELNEVVPKLPNSEAVQQALNDKLNQLKKSKK